MAKDKEIVEAGSSLPAEYVGFEDYAGAGHEEVGQKDIALPFISILQSGSPQVKKQGPQFITGAEDGSLFHTVSNALWKGESGLVVVNCYFQPRFVEWVPRSKGGGFISQYRPEEKPPTVRNEETGRDSLPNGNDLVNTHYHFCLLIDAEKKEYEQAVVAMASTQVKKSTRWNSKLLNLKLALSNGKGKFTPPRFSATWAVKSKYEENEKGSWYGFEIEFKEYLNLQDPFYQEVFQAAKAFYDFMKSQQLEVKPPDREEDSGPLSIPSESGVELEGDVPF